MNRTRPLFTILKSKIKRPPPPPSPRATFPPPRSPRYTYYPEQNREPGFFTKCLDFVKEVVSESFYAMGAIVIAYCTMGGTILVLAWGYLMLDKKLSDDRKCDKCRQK